MSRTHAALSHLLFSVLIFSAIFSVLILYWYPTPYFSASGGWQGLKIAALVDLVLGPVLTFLVIKKGKAVAKIKFDILAILTIQISALVWGVNTIYQQRPVASVLWEDSFYTVPASAISDSDIKKLDQFGVTSPVYVWVEKPINTDELKVLRDEMIKLNKPPYQLVGRYKTLIKGEKSALEFAKLDINEIIQRSALMAKKIDIFLDAQNKTLNDYIYLPLKSKYRNIILIFSQKGELEGNIIVPITK